jgi:hypothetical protein
LRTPKTTIRVPSLTARQKEVLAHPARILHLPGVTKSGKTFALDLWLADGVLSGQSCIIVAPWFPRIRAHFETMKAILQPFIANGEVQVSESLLRLRAKNGGGLDCFSADNPQGIYGPNADRVVIDELSRIPAAAWPACLTVISGRNGKIRTALNLELGGKNWGIRTILRLQQMTPIERESAGEDFIFFGPDSSLVPAEIIDLMKPNMPAQLFDALYRGVIPQDDTSLFRNLDEIFSGLERAEPEPGHSYVAGIDLGRKTDYTVITILDDQSGAVVAGDRFHEISWTVQYERCALLYKKFHCHKAWCDETGLGDPAIEELRKRGLEIEGFVFSQPSRKSLIETLIIACDQKQITLPAEERFSIWRQEMESFEYQLDGSTVKYAAPPNFHDDTVMSLALAVYGRRQAGSGVLGLIDWFASGAYKELLVDEYR